MGRKLLIGDKAVIEATGLAADVDSEPTVCENVDLITYDIIWASGVTPDFTVTPQWSHDNVTWRDLDFGATIQINTVSGGHKIDIEPNFKYVRMSLTRNAGSANITCIVKGTTKGA